MKSYDPKKVSVIVDGSYLVGFMDGTFVQAEKNEDNIKTHVGADGEVTVTEVADNTGTITVTLKQNSTSLAKIKSLATQKKQFAAQVIDQNDGNFKAGGSQCRILKTPSREFGDDVSGVEVAIFVGDYSVS
jgi:hypothetical protein